MRSIRRAGTDNSGGPRGSAQEPDSLHPDHPDVFISYSRRDSDVVDDVAAELAARDFAVWLDRHDIPPAADWRDRIEQGIASAGAFAIMLTNSSMSSEECRREIEIAVELGKRIIPVSCGKVEVEVPAAVRARNRIELSTPARTAQQIIRAAQLDTDWVDEHTRLLMRAREWRATDLSRSMLLRGKDLRSVRRIVDSTQATEPSVTALQKDFVAASVSWQHTRRIAGVCATLAVLAVVGAGLIAWEQRQDAVAAERVTSSLRLGADARLLYDEQLDLGLLLALAAERIDENAEARGALLAGLTHGPGVREIAVLTSASLDEASLSADGSVAVFLSDDGVPTVWQVEDRDADLRERAMGAPAVDVAVDGQLVAAALADGTVVTTSVRTGTSSCAVSSRPVVMSVNSSSNRVAVATEGDGDADVYVVEVFEPDTCTASRLESDGRVSTLSTSHDGRVLAIAHHDGSLDLWDLEQELPFPSPAAVRSRVNALSFSVDGSRLLGALADGSVVVWDPWTENEPRVIIAPDPIREMLAVSFGIDKELAVAGDDSGAVWPINLDDTVEVGLPMVNLPQDRGGTPVLAVSRSADGDEARSIHADGRFLRWMIADQSPLAERVADDFGIASMLVGRDRIVVGGSQGVYELESNERATRRLSDLAVSSLVQLGDRLFGAVEGGRVVEIEPTGAIADLFVADSDITALAALGEGKLAFGTELGEVWLISDDGRVDLLGSHDGAVRVLASTTRGDLLVSGGDDFLVRAWDPIDRSLVLEFAEHAGTVDALAIHPDGREIASAGDDRVVLLWDLASPSATKSLIGHTDRVLSLAWSDDGANVVSTSEDATTILWDAELAVALSPPLRHPSGVQSEVVAFRPGSSDVILTAGTGVDEWELGDVAARRAACDLAHGRALSAAEARSYGLDERDLCGSDHFGADGQ